MRTVTVSMLKDFGIDEGVELKVIRRGAAPLGGGEIRFRCPIVKTLNPVQRCDEGKVKRIRGVAYTTRVNPSIGNRVVASARGVFNNLITDFAPFPSSPDNSSLSFGLREKNAASDPEIIADAKNKNKSIRTDMMSQVEPNPASNAP